MFGFECVAIEVLESQLALQARRVQKSAATPET